MYGSLSFAQSPAEETQSAFETYQSSFPQEKVFLHTDKPAYLLGETIWVKAYLMDAQLHFASPLSNIVYVELIGPGDTVVTRLNVWIIQGEGKGDFDIPLTAPAGTYRLRAFTQYMRNYPEGYLYEQVIPVYPPLAKEQAISSTKAPEIQGRKKKDKSQPVELSFYPEGGELVEEMPTRVAVRAEDKMGNPLNIAGRIVDAFGTEVCQFETYQKGMTTFPLKPAAGQRYKAEVQWEGATLSYSLPAPLEEGFGLQTRFRGEDLILTLRSNLNSGLEGAYLLGHLRGQVFCRVENLAGPMQRLKVPLTDVSEGVAHFTLFDRSNRPVAERLAFISHAQSRPSLDIQMGDTLYPNRSLASATVSILSGGGESTGGQLSASIYEVGFDSLGANEMDIQTYLLLQSDLPGKKIDLQGLVSGSGLVEQARLDLIMMTQGWRRFVWRDLLEKGEPELKYPNEEGVSFGGQVFRSNALGQPVQAEVILSGFTDKFFMERTLTDEEGRFYFSGFNFVDSLKLTLMAGTYKKKKGSRRDTEGQTISLTPTGNRNVDIRLSEYGWPKVMSLPSNQNQLSTQKAQEIVEAEEEWVEELAEEYAKLKEIDLDAVVIEAQQKTKADAAFERGGALYGEPDTRLDFDSIPRARTALTIFDVMQGRVPGIEIIGPVGEKVVRVRGISSITQSPVALFLLDGAPVSPITANSLDVNRVASVEIVRGLKAASVYGEQGGGGIVAIYTRRAPDGTPISIAPEPGTLELFHPGYYQAREFAAPWYEESLPEHVQLDYRTTLHWEPELELDKGKNERISFYTADRKTNYVVVIQGMTDQGEPVVGKAYFKVR